jgi:hypothetical protein
MKKEKKRGASICGLVEVLKDVDPPAGHPTGSGVSNRRQWCRPPNGSGDGGGGSQGQAAVGACNPNRPPPHLFIRALPGGPPWAAEGRHQAHRPTWAANRPVHSSRITTLPGSRSPRDPLQLSQSSIYLPEFTNKPSGY